MPVLLHLYITAEIAIVLVSKQFTTLLNKCVKNMPKPEDTTIVLYNMEILSCCIFCYTGT